MALVSSEQADLEDRAETRSSLLDLEYLARHTGVVDREESPADLTLEVPTNSVPDRVIFAAQRRLIGRSGPMDLYSCRLAE